MATNIIPQMFFESVEKYGERTATKYKVDGEWRATSYKQWGEQVENAALGLKEKGIKRGDKAAILSENRPEWVIADISILCLGGSSVPVYPTLEPMQIRYILNHCEAALIFVENEDQLKKILEVRADLPHLKYIIVSDSYDDSLKSEGVLMLDEIIESGKKNRGKKSGDLKKSMNAIDEDDLASIVYTSGTTGIPKGVMLTHKNFMSNVHAALQVLKITSEDTFLSFLPLSHVFERMAGYYTTISVGSTICYAESIAAVPQNLQEIAPTIIVSVPRIYEKMYSKVLENIESEAALKRNLFEWALGVGKKRLKLKSEGRSEIFNEAAFMLADKLVFSKVKQKLGGNLRFSVSGGAPLERRIAEFFGAMGITIVEGYGLTETSPVTNVNRLDDIRFGTVGPALPGVEIKILDDGEILIKGPNVMKGYFKDEQSTKEAFTEDGWFKTGDIGFIKDGFLTITDRKKELIVTSGGKNVAPQPIENLLKSSQLVSQVMCVGDKKKFVGALIVPNFDYLEEWAAKNNIAASNREKLVEHPEVLKLYQSQMDELMKDLPKYEKVKKFVLVPKEWTQENKELTPTLKLMRKNIQKHYEDQIEKIYQ